MGRYLGRSQGDKDRAGTPRKSRNDYHSPKMGHAFVHTVIDDYSRVGYAGSSQSGV